MKTPKGNILPTASFTALAILVFGTGVILWQLTSRDNQQAHINTAYYQLKTICARVDQILHDDEQGTVSEALEKVIEDQNKQTLFFQYDTRAPVVLNGDAGKWRSPPEAVEGVLAYFPHWFTDRSTGDRFCVAIGVDQQRRLLAKLPEWESAVSPD